MEADMMNIAELAAAAGLSRRAIRFYVQRGLISPPHGRGRGHHYDNEHLEQLKRIRDLQVAGHSLDAIRKIMTGHAVDTPKVSPDARKVGRPRPRLQAGLWTRVDIADGVELHLDTAKLNLEVTELLAIQQAIRQILGNGKVEDE
jgi:DNA-binding transcriptional MerR regulator